MGESGVCLREFTNRIGGVSPNPLTLGEKGFVVFCESCLLPCSGVVRAASVAVGKVDDSEIWEGNNLCTIDRSDRYNHLQGRSRQRT